MCATIFAASSSPSPSPQSSSRSQCSGGYELATLRVPVQRLFRCSPAASPPCPPPPPPCAHCAKSVTQKVLLVPLSSSLSISLALETRLITRIRKSEEGSREGGVISYWPAPCPRVCVVCVEAIMSIELQITQACDKRRLRQKQRRRRQRHQEGVIRG